jgi:hypothetical protein
MTSGQTRVVVLLIVLLALEAIRSPAVKAWVQSGITALSKMLGGTSA